MFNTIISINLGFSVGSRSRLCAGYVIACSFGDGRLDNHIIIILGENQWLMALYSVL